VKREEAQVAEGEAAEADSILSDWGERAAKSVMRSARTIY
jgi:hypothetical protein